MTKEYKEYKMNCKLRTYIDFNNIHSAEERFNFLIKVCYFSPEEINVIRAKIDNAKIAAENFDFNEMKEFDQLEAYLNRLSNQINFAGYSKD